MTALAVFAPLLAALLLSPLLARVLGRNTGWAFAAAYLASAAVLLPAAGRALDGHHDAVRVPWVPSLGVSFALRVDGLSVVFALIALLVGAVVLIYSTRYLEDRPNLSFYIVMGTFTFSMVALVLADDLVLLFLTWEMTSIASFLLIARSGKPGEPGSMRTLLVTFIGGLALLAAVVLVVVRTGTTVVRDALYHDAFDDPVFAGIVAVLVLVAGFTKAAQFPFHVWLPDAMAATTPVSAYLHAAAVVKAGIFLLLRFSPALHDVPIWDATLVTVGLVTAAMGALFALQHTDLKKVMAYSTVSQLGFIVSMIGVGTIPAISAAILHTIAHALFKSGLFMMVGIIDKATKTRDTRRLPALREHLPVSFWLTALGCASMAGVPPLLGFVSKESLFEALLHPRGPAVLGWLALAGGVLVSIMTFAYSGKILLGGFVDGRDDRPVRRPSRVLVASAALPILVGVPLGLMPGLLGRLVGRATEASIPGTLQWDPDLSLWHGLTIPLAATVLVYAAGLVILARRRQVWRRLEHPWLPRDGAEVLNAIDHLTVRVGSRLARLVQAEHPSRQLTPMVVAFTAVLFGGGAALLIGGTLPDRVPGTDRLTDHSTDLVFLVVLTVAVIVVCRATSRLGAAVGVGAVGIVATVQILSLGAPDVALTQLLVETLTVIITMLALQRLPRSFRPITARRHRFTLALALAAGAAAAVGTWVLTGRRERSDIAHYYLTETQPLTGGANIVNVILVEFRALDTFGEIAVLGMSGIAILALYSTIHPRHLDPGVTRSDLPPLRPPPDTPAHRAVAPAWSNVLGLQIIMRWFGPVLTAASVLIFVRGHNEPGGGFVAALVAASLVGLGFLSHSEDRRVGRSRLPHLLIGGGLLAAVGTGLVDLAVAGSFLQPLHATVLGVHLSTAIVFDVGVYAAVLGLGIVAFNLLGTSPRQRLSDATADIVSADPVDPQPEQASPVPQISKGTLRVGARTTYLVDGIDPEAGS